MDEILDFEFDEWFDIFTDKCRELGYIGPIDKYTFESDWEQGKTPEFSAEGFVKEIMDNHGKE
jgi:hypothetical protein